MRSLALIEHGLIRNARDFPNAVQSPSELFVSDQTFRHLCSMATDQEGTDPLLTFFWQKGRETIRVRNYVGLIGLPDGTYLEILPKIGRDEEARTVLLSMLRHVRHSPFRTLTPARMSATHLPLWEVFILAFFDALEPLVRQGVQCAYVTVERNESFVRGKFQPARHQRENAHDAQRLAVAYDRLTPDCPPNRVLKTALVYLQNRSVSLSLAGQQRMRQLLWALDDVPTSETVQDDLDKARCNNRLFRTYEPALQWAEALLNGQAFGVKAGQFLTISLLFPMQRVFEEYVAHVVRRHWPEGDVTVQESSAHLVEQHAGAPKFKLRPDLLIRHNGRTLVLDTKWQHIKGAEPGTGNYGVQQPDLYQLYAYGKKYGANDVFLIYPANEHFQQPLDLFGYDTDSRLHVVPFDVTEPPADEVEKLAAYALSFRQ